MLKTTISNLFGFFLLFFFVLLVDLPIIQFSMLYPEQPAIYLANQNIHSLKDLLDIYLHPILFNNAIPFFRPSGHFLIYQLLSPILGWHNIKALIVVNLFFLSLCGFLIIKMYPLFFPKFKIGGYIAFALYLMNPALSLSKLIALHFEFVYVFFVLLSLYCVMIFCQKNIDVFREKSDRWQSIYLTLFALMFYVLAVTFKEPSLLLGPLLILYFCFFSYDSSLKKSIRFLIKEKILLKILILFCIMSLVLGIYLTLPWPTLSHPTRVSLDASSLNASGFELIKILLGWQNSSIVSPGLQYPDMIWRGVVFPKSIQAIIWSFLSITLVAFVLLFFTKTKKLELSFKKSFLFLLIAVILFLILPIAWGMGLAWHLNLSLVFLSFLMGFAFDYVLKNQRYKTSLGGLIALTIGATAWNANSANVNRYDKNTNDHYLLSIVRNAVLNPPKLQNQLKDDSILIVEDSKIHNPYILGNSIYPLFLATNYSEIAAVQPFYFLKADHLYNGTLFRFAYLKPSLKEEVYPFEVNDMEQVADGALYHWLQHINDIFCVGYDTKGFWHDKTAEFKKNLLKEQADRLLKVNHFSEFSGIQLMGQFLYKSNLMLPDPLMCQLTCDQDVSCSGFTYSHPELGKEKISQCQFYGTIASKEQFCGSCVSYVKQG